MRRYSCNHSPSDSSIYMFICIYCTRNAAAITTTEQNRTDWMDKFGFVDGWR